MYFFESEAYLSPNLHFSAPFLGSFEKSSYICTDKLYYCRTLKQYNNEETFLIIRFDALADAG